MFENFHGVFLWEHLSSEPLTASAKRHYDVIKRLAMETCLNYVREHRAGVDPLLVVAGSEPIEFVASFTVWTSPDKSLKRDDDVSDDVTTSIYSSIVCRRHGNHRSLVTSSAA